MTIALAIIAKFTAKHGSTATKNAGQADQSGAEPERRVSGGPNSSLTMSEPGFEIGIFQSYRAFAWPREVGWDYVRVAGV